MTQATLNPTIQNESFRLAELYRLELLDTPADAEFDAMVNLGKNLFNCAFCTVAFLDDERQWFKAKAGIAVGKTNKEDSFCKYTIQSDEPYVINNAEEDVRVKDSPLVTGAPWIRSYLGIPLLTLKGARIGTYCLIDTATRVWSDNDIRLAKDLAKVIERLLHRHESQQNLGFKLSHKDSTNALDHETEFGAWELREDETLLTLSPSLRQMFGICDDLPIHKSWFERFGVNRPLDSWSECAQDIDGIEAIKFSILRPDGQRAFFEETLYVKNTGKKNTLVGLVRRINQQPSIETSVQDTLQWTARQPIDAEEISILEFLQNKGHGFAVLGNDQKINAVFDHWESKNILRPPAIKLSDCFSEEDCQAIVKQFSQFHAGIPSQTLFVKLKSNRVRGQWLKINTCVRATQSQPANPQKVIQFVQLVEQPEVKRRTSVSHALNELLETSTCSGAWYYSMPEHKIHPTPNVCVLMSLRPMPTLSRDYFLGRLSEMTQRDMAKQIGEVVLRKMKLSFEFESSNHMGEPTCFHCSVEPCMNTEGELVGVRGLLRDITELRQSQIKLFELEDLNDRITTNLAEGIIDVDAAGCVTSTNLKARELLNISSSDYCVGACIHDLLMMASQSTITELTQSMSVNGSSHVMKVNIQSSNTWLSVQLFAKTNGFRVLLRNINQALHNESEISLLKTALDETEDAVLITSDIQGRRGDISIAYANKGFEKLAGVQAAALVGHTPKRLVHTMLSKRASQKIAVSILNHRPVQFKTLLTREASAPITCQVKVQPIFSGRQSEVLHLITLHPLKG